LAAAWKDPEWGLAVWLVMVTGMRRGELCAIRWRNLDLLAGTMEVKRTIGQRGSATWEKDTKTHQQRRVALDVETVELLRAHRLHCERTAEAVGVALAEDAFVFSGSPDGSKHLVPDSVSQRYGKLAKRLGIRTSSTSCVTTQRRS
jgi:integrase